MFAKSNRKRTLIMAEFKGTRGTWKYEHDSRTITSSGKDFFKSSKEICTINALSIGQIEAWGNAKLIAAAPEMLQMLKNLLDDNISYWEADEDRASQIYEVEALIKKATE
jgi:hypothetical protein